MAHKKTLRKIKMASTSKQVRYASFAFMRWCEIRRKKMNEKVDMAMDFIERNDLQEFISLQKR